MSWLLVLVVVLVLVGALAAITAKAKNAPTGTVGFPYEPTRFLFSAAERSFLGVLDQAVGPDHRVLGKVRLADVAKVRGGLTKSARPGALNRIAGKHVDFLVCRASDLAIVCAVELNDRSHASRRAQARDELVANVCRAIGLPLVMVPAREAYAVAEVREQILAAVNAAPHAPPANAGKRH